MASNILTERQKKGNEIIIDRKEKDSNMFDDYNACNNSFGYKTNAMAIEEEMLLQKQANGHKSIREETRYKDDVQQVFVISISTYIRIEYNECNANSFASNFLVQFPLGYKQKQKLGRILCKVNYR